LNAHQSRTKVEDEVVALAVGQRFENAHAELDGAVGDR
jgi:hypothetical protein